jgi:hypothetical protein
VKSKFFDVIAAVILVAAFAPGAFPQTTAPPPPGPPMHAFDYVAFEDPVEGWDGNVVTGVPFSAEVTTEMIQTLSDGNTIEHKSTGMVARDSQGRVRREMVLPHLGPLAVAGEAPRIVSIIDPVAGKRYFLDENKKIAREVPLHGEGKFGAKFEGKRLRSFDTNAEIKTESLGSQTIEGLAVEGTRVTHTIPAKAIGNTNPIISTTERWYSRDLQLNLLVKRSDPRLGNSTSQLTNINREEPAQSLFTVPADYTIKKPRALGDESAFPVKPDQD